MKTVNRFCRDCYQTTPHETRYLDGRSYECSVCKNSGSSIWMEESKKEETKAANKMKKEERTALKVLEK